MTTIDAETLVIFERTLRGVLGAHDAGTDASAALVDVGWRDFLAVDPATVVPLVFGQLGELVLPSTALDDVAFAALHEDAGAHFGDDVAFAHPRAGVAGGRLTDGELAVDAVVLGARRGTPLALVAVSAEDGLHVVTVDAGAVDTAAAGGMDPALGLVRARGTVARRGVVVHDDLDAGAVAVACRRALAYELTGLAGAMLTMATEYAKVRTQFGRPIGAFQAVKHRVADVFVARRAATVVIDESWWSEPELMTPAAKSLAARACSVASQNCLQVLGAIGFTLEHDLHHYMRRGKVLDRLYGSERELRIELGRALQARGRVPRPGTFRDSEEVDSSVK